jgi:hypothetical protein
MFGSLGKRQVSDKITTWFHKKGEGNISAAHTVAVVQSKFVNFCKSKNLNLAVSQSQLKESLSEATCVMYYGELVNKTWVGPKRDFTVPQNWTKDYEKQWEEYLNYVFTDDYWDKFWRTISFGSFEGDVPRWRVNMQLILPKYILRESEILKTNGQINEQKQMYDEKTQENIYYEEEPEYD